MVIVKTENRSSNNIQKTSPESYKTEIKILILVYSGSEQPGPGATLLGWPKINLYIITLTQYI